MAKKSYIQINGKLVDKEELASDFVSVPAIHEDIKPYRSMMTGEMIEGRAQHRNHLRKHGVVEVGNDLNNAKPQSVRQPDSLKRDIARAVYEKLRY